MSLCKDAMQIYNLLEMQVPEGTIIHYSGTIASGGRSTQIFYSSTPMDYITTFPFEK